MPRLPVWQRAFLISLAPTAAGSLTSQLNFTAGATLRRLRYEVMIQSHQDVPFAQLPPSQLVMGTTLLDGNPVPAPPDPLGGTLEEWLWWEGMSAWTFQHTIVAPTYVTLDGPRDGGVRDVKAQRVIHNDFPQLCWTWNQSINPTFTPQWTVQVSYSALVETAP